MKNALQRGVSLNLHLAAILNDRALLDRKTRADDEALLRAGERADRLARRGLEGGAPRSTGAGESAAAPQKGDRGSTANPPPPDSAEALGDISPLSIDPNITFASIGGLPQHILTLKEMVLLPLLYPDLIQSLGISVPRGVLFYGPPGTGKTLLARALANEASSLGRGRAQPGEADRKLESRGISFFMRKGGDLLSKWVGESERQLKLLFDEARRRQPSIIFFDEIDGIAPVRNSSRENTHGSVVSTLLALMDGLDSRGEVIVIGATNRPDALDPALRRPGRFDRELCFSSPGLSARRHILAIQLQKSFSQHHLDTAGKPGTTAEPLVPGDLTIDGVASPSHHSILDFLAEKTEGWSGADLKALVAEASLTALRRSLPAIYTSSSRFIVDSKSVKISLEDFRVALARVQPTSGRSAAGGASLALTHGPHCDFLVNSQKREILEKLKSGWGAAWTAFTQQETKTDDLQVAMSEFAKGRPNMLQTGGGGGGSMYLILSGADDFSLRILTGAVAKGLPSFTVKSLHMPNIASIHGDSSIGDDSGLAVAGADGQPNSGGRGLAGGASTFSEFIGRVVAGSGGPTVLVLLGFDKWCAEHSDYGTRPVNGIGAITQSQSEGVRAVGAPNTPPSSSAKSLNRSATAESVAELSGSPCLNEELKASLSALRYHLDRLTFSNVLVVIPTAQSIAAGAYLPSTISRMLPTSRDSCFHNVMQFTIQPPTTADLQSFMEYVFEEKIASCVSILPPMDQWNSLEIDMHAGADLFRRFSADPARREAERKRKQEERLQRWNDIQYKRAQMRLVLRSWTNQLLSTASLRPLFHGDLDLAEKPDQEEELKHWRQHVARFVANRAQEKQLLEGKQGRTRKTAANAKDSMRLLALSDILEKLDRCEYLAVSQYNDDVEDLCRCVMEHFDGPDPRCMRYRSKAAQLKELTMLANHRISRQLARFCEETILEPTVFQEEPLEGEGQGNPPPTNGKPNDPRPPPPMPLLDQVTAKAAAEGATQGKRVGGARRKRRRYYGDGPKRKPKPKPKAQPPAEEGKGEDGGSDEGGEEEESEEGEAAGEEVVEVTQGSFYRPNGNAHADGVAAELGPTLDGSFPEPPRGDQGTEAPSDGSSGEVKNVSSPTSASAPGTLLQLQPLDNEAWFISLAVSYCQKHRLNPQALHGLYSDLQCCDLVQRYPLTSAAPPSQSTATPKGPTVPSAAPAPLPSARQLTRTECALRIYHFIRSWIQQWIGVGGGGKQ